MRVNYKVRLKVHKLDLRCIVRGWWSLCTLCLSACQVRVSARLVVTNVRAVRIMTNVRVVRIITNVRTVRIMTNVRAVRVMTNVRAVKI